MHTVRCFVYIYILKIGAQNCSLGTKNAIAKEDETKKKDENGEKPISNSVYPMQIVQNRTHFTNVYSKEIWIANFKKYSSMLSQRQTTLKIFIKSKSKI